MIRVSNVRKRFGKLVALDGVSLLIQPGERIALVGANGSGKTTLMRAIVGLLRVEGAVEISGVDVAKRPEVALRMLAYVPQIAPPLDAPVAELIRACCALRSLDPQSVERRASRFDLDVKAISNARVRDLSGGMKQKLLASIALASQAPILVCDEPTASLDAAARAVFVDEVRARPADSVLILCSHRVEEVRQLVDRVVELKDGRVVGDSTVRRDTRTDLTFLEHAA